MAIYMNYNQINDYMKIASGKDSCWICAKKKGAQPGRDAYDTLKELEGAIENEPVIVIRRSGIDTCICMNCIKQIYNEHISSEIPKEDTSSNTKELVDENTEDKKSSKSKKDK